MKADLVCCKGIDQNHLMRIRRDNTIYLIKTALTLNRYVYRKAEQILIYLPFVSFIFYQC